VVADWEGDGELEAAVSGGKMWLESADGAVPLGSGRVRFRGFGLVVAEEGVRTSIAMRDAAWVDLGDLREIVGFSIDDVEALKAVEWKVQNISERTGLISKRVDGVVQEGACASHLNAAHFRVGFGRGFGGLLIRKVYDRFHGRQRARVLVDGEVVGMWYEPVEDRVNRWGVGEFWVPGEFVSGRESVVVTIDPPSGTPLWSVGRVEVFGVGSSGVNPWSPKGCTAT
jgi:hypothetical protein